jgi:hypothetical protein
LLVHHPDLFVRATIVGAHPGLDDETLRTERAQSDEQWARLLENERESAPSSNAGKRSRSLRRRLGCRGHSGTGFDVSAFGTTRMVLPAQCECSGSARCRASPRSCLPSLCQ